MSAAEFAIDVHGVTKTFGDRVVVDAIDMQVRRGEIYGFLGPNGSGKTTFLRMLCGLLTPDAGEGTLPRASTSARESREIKRQVGYMTQRFSFYEDLTIEENLDFVARIYGVRDRARRGARTPRAPRAHRRPPPARRRRSPEAGSSASPWPPASSRSRSSCCSTSPPPASIPRRGAISGRRSTGSPPRASRC